MKNFYTPKTKIVILLSASIGIFAGSGKAEHQYENFPPVFNLTSLNGKNGFFIDGNDTTGFSISNAGDINGDNIDDILIGDPFANNDVGQSYVVFGSKEPWSATIDLSSLNGGNGFAINGIHPNDHSGWSVSGAGDINGDEVDDFLIGAPAISSGGIGHSYVVFGSKDPWPAIMDLSILNGKNGFIINGIHLNDRSGTSVSRAGDVNGDGIDDIIIGASYVSNYSGQSYVVFGSKAPWPAAIDLSSLNGVNGFTLNGLPYKSDGITDISVSGAGDVNGDGIDDIIIGAGNRTVHECYIVFGSKAPWPAVIDLADLNGNNGFAVNESSRDWLVYWVSGAGDVNGDHIDDIIIGTEGGGDEAGQSYVIFGSKEPWPAVMDLASLNGNNGFSVMGGKNGNLVSGAGDINRDGLGDIIIGAGGQSYVIFGSKEPWPAMINIVNLNGNNGFIANGIHPDAHGVSSVSGAGDVNGDNIDDILIGRPYANNSIGQTYIIFGSLGNGPSPSDDNSLAIGLGITGGLIGLTAISVGSYYGYRYYHRSDYTQIQ